MILVIGLLLGGLGLALFAWGWRGRRLDDHPVCRRCRYDLTGVYPRIVRCPECGVKLVDARRIRVGNRGKRVRLILSGLFVIALAGAVFGVEKWATAHGFKWAKIKPTWLLVWDAASDGDEAFHAFSELTHRYQSEALSADRIGQITELALQRQGDRAEPWPYTARQWLDTAMRRDQLSDNQWERYLRQAVRLELKVRSKVRRGDPIPMEIVESIDRSAASYGSILGQWRVLKLEIDEQKYEASRPADSSLKAVFIEGAFSGSPFPGQRNPPDLLFQPANDALWALELGTHRVRLTLEVDGTRNPPGGYLQRRGLNYPRRDQLTTMRWQVVCEARFDVVDTSTETVALLDKNPSRSTLRIQRVSARPSNRGNDVYVQVDFGSFWEPQCLAFDVILRDGDREWLCGGFTGELRTDLFPLSSNYVGPATGASLEGFDAQSVDVIARPSRYRARRTIGVTAILGEEIIFEDVPVTWPDNALPPPRLFNERDVEAALQSAPAPRP